MKRYAAVIWLEPEHAGEYLQLHRAAWPEVLEQIRASMIANYSIFSRQFPDGRALLLSYFEYAGEDFEKDMCLMAAHEPTRRWWDVCKPCLSPVEGTDTAGGEFWANMDEIFHTA